MNIKKRNSGVDVNKMYNPKKNFKKNDPMPPPSYEEIRHDRGFLLDIKLNFGKWRGFTIGEMLDDPDGRRYVTTYLLSKETGFPFEFQDKVAEIVENFDD